jgi:hypothetical protein
MPILRRVVDSGMERRIVIGLITSKDFLSQAATVLSPSLLGSLHLALVGRWCLDYFAQYREAPGRHIESLYQAWCEREGTESDLQDAVHDLLSSLSEEYDQAGELNVPYLLDEMAAHLTLRKLDQVKDRIEDSLSRGDLEDAQQAIRDYTSVEVGMGEGVDILHDGSAWKAAYSEQAEALIDFKGEDASRFFGNAFARDSLVAILAPEKRGKTWWCVEFTMRALKARRKVALFEVGDMSESQILKRFGVRLTRRPLFPRDVGSVEVPVELVKEEDDWEVKTEEVECLHTASLSSVKKAVKKFRRATGLDKGGPYVQVSCHPNSSVNVSDLTNILDKWEMEKGFVPDVIIIDYPDILAPEFGTSNYTTRDQTNATWKALRRLSQERHCLVIAPTQADAASYNVHTLGMENFSEDKRKAAHVTGMLGLNQTKEEKAQNIMRLNWIVLRESDFSTDRFLRVGQCLPLGRAFCCSKCSF